jgi:hypothetical protein
MLKGDDMCFEAIKLKIDAFGIIVKAKRKPMLP